MRSEYSIDATGWHAVELSYQVIVLEDGHSMYDSRNSSASQTIERIKRGLKSIARVVKSQGIVF